jgi:translation initiation factor 1
LKPKHTFRGVVMRTDPARRQAALKPPSVHRGPAPVRVGREVAGRAGKGVSVIQGLPLGADELEELATRLKKLCGAGGAVKDEVIEIQGDHRDRLVAELRRLGYEAKRSGG